MKKLFKIENGKFKAEVQEDEEWGEFQVVFFKNGKKMKKETTYYTCDLEDAENTAKLEMERMIILKK